MTGWDEDFQLTDEVVQQMIDLLRDEAPVTFIAQGLKFHYLHSSLVHYFKGPILSCEPDLDTGLGWIVTAVWVERLEMVIAEHRAGIVGRLSTLADVMAYLFPAANAQLLPKDWVAIYCYVAVTTLARHDLQSEKTVIMPLFESYDLTPAEQERLAALRCDIRQMVVKLARRREIIWPGQSCSVPGRNQFSFRQLANRQGKARRILKSLREINDHVKEEETKKSSPVTSGDTLAPSSRETTPPDAPDASGRAEADPWTASTDPGR